MVELYVDLCFFFFQAEDGIRDYKVTGVQTCALPIYDLLENEVGHGGLEIPVDHRERGEVEGGVRAHQHPDPTGASKDGTEHEPDDRGLFGAGEPLERIVRQPKHQRGEEHDERPSAHARSEQLAEALEQVPPEHGLFSETRTDNRSEEHTSELQSPCNLVCRLLLEKKK